MKKTGKKSIKCFDQKWCKKKIYWNQNLILTMKITNFNRKILDPIYFSKCCLSYWYNFVICQGERRALTNLNDCMFSPTTTLLVLSVNEKHHLSNVEAKIFYLKNFNFLIPFFLLTIIYLLTSFFFTILQHFRKTAQYLNLPIIFRFSFVSSWFK